MICFFKKKNIFIIDRMESIGLFKSLFYWVIYNLYLRATSIIQTQPDIFTAALEILKLFWVSSHWILEDCDKYKMNIYKLSMIFAL